MTDRPPEHPGDEVKKIEMRAYSSILEDMAAHRRGNMTREQLHQGIRERLNRAILLMEMKRSIANDS